MRLLTHQITASVDPEMFAAVLALAADDEVTRAEVQRRALRECLARRGYLSNEDDAEVTASTSPEQQPARVSPG